MQLIRLEIKFDSSLHAVKKIKIFVPENYLYEMMFRNETIINFNQFINAMLHTRDIYLLIVLR
jgi:hypothetical protein